MKCTIKWLGQAGFLMDFGDITVCVDPYLSNSVEEIEGMARLMPAPIQPEDIHNDYMIFTHDHLDHFDYVSLVRIQDDKIRYIGPRSCIDRLPEIPAERKTCISRGESVKLSDSISVRAVFAKHTPDSVGLLFYRTGADKGGICLTGDTLYDDQLLSSAVYQPDVLITCINGKLNNMGYLEAAHVAEGLGVKTAIPCHYGMFAKNNEDPQKFVDALAGKPIEVVLPSVEPGVTVEFQ